jgi:uncharacterized cupin superfamily protein
MRESTGSLGSAAIEFAILSAMKKPILNMKEIEYAGFPGGLPAEVQEKYAGTMGDIGRRMGAVKIGANITIVPPGKRVFPFHNHHVNEEFFLVLEGEGQLRFGAETHPLTKGDFVLCPPGGADVAHQIINTGTEDMRVLGISTKEYPEIADYPDSGKFGVLTETFRFIGRAKESLNYWEGE